MIKLKIKTFKVQVNGQELETVFTLNHQAEVDVDVVGDALRAASDAFVARLNQETKRVAGALDVHENPPICTREGAGGWQECSEQMPDDDTLVLIYTANDAMLMAHHDERGWWDRDNILITAGVTHWCDPVPPMLADDEVKS